MKVDKADKGMLAFAPVAGVAALALLAIPLLPALFAANPDQVNWARLTTACRSPRLSPACVSPRLRLLQLALLRTRWSHGKIDSRCPDRRKATRHAKMARS